MNLIEQLVQYHEERAAAIAAAAVGAGMAKARVLDTDAERHRRWASFLRTLQPPAHATRPRLHRGGAS